MDRLPGEVRKGRAQRSRRTAKARGVAAATSRTGRVSTIGTLHPTGAVTPASRDQCVLVEGEGAVILANTERAFAFGAAGAASPVPTRCFRRALSSYIRRSADASSAS